MKKYIYITVAAFAVLAFGCNKEVAPTEEGIDPIEKNTGATEGKLVTYTFTASSKELKSELSNAGVFSWSEGDQIAIYNTTTSAYVTFSVTKIDGSGNATISAEAAEGAVWTNAIYPAARAVGSGNAVDYTVTTVSGPILVSDASGGETLSFKYLGAVANIKVSDVPGTPTTLTFTANANVFGSRTFSWSGGSPVLGGSGTQASITVPFTNATIVSVPIPQVSYEGFTITVDNASGRHLYKKTTSNTFDMSSKKLLPMPALTYSAPAGYYVKTTSSTGYWDTAAARMIQTGANTYELSENCDGNTTYYIYDEYNTDQPTVGYLATDLARSSFSTGTSEWSLVGDVNGNGWTIESGHVAMSYEGNWHYAKNVTFDNIVDEEEDYAHFLIVKSTDTSWDDVTKYGAANIYPGNTGTAYATLSGSWDIYAKNIVADTEYDIFFNTSTLEVRLFLSSASHDPYEASGIWKFTYNSSSDAATHTWMSSTTDYPFGDSSFPTTGYGIKGAWDSWVTPYTSNTTYANNSWVISGLAPGAAGSFGFGLCDSSPGYWTALCTDASISTVALDANLYGTLTYWSDGGLTNPSVTLENATYNIYVNVNPSVSGGVNLMFVKQ